MQRRHFLQTGSALGAMGLVSGCATMGGGSGPKVVVIGGVTRVPRPPSTCACGLNKRSRSP